MYDFNLQHTMQLVKAVVRYIRCPTASAFSRGRSIEFLRTYSSDPVLETDKPTQRKRTKKSITEKEKTKIEAKNVENLQVEPSFPFECAESANGHRNDVSPDVERVDSLNGVRHYYVTTNPEECYCFPSVTTVLDATQPPEMYFRLRHWRKGLVREHGEQGSIDIARGIIESGKNFHKVQPCIYSTIL